MITFTNWDIIRNLLFALQWTLLLSFIAFIGGSLVTILLTTIRIMKIRWLKTLINSYCALFQGIPLLMQLFLSFFGLGLLGIDVEPIFAASFALTLYTSAYLIDIWSGSINAIDKGQWEASRCLGLNFSRTLIAVILPQATRIALAPTVGFIVQVIKSTSLASIIGFVELTRAGTLLNNVTYESFKVFSFVAIGYFIICYPISCYSQYLEKKLNANYHR
ncbi:amino acid ABC transporter permease [Orbus mooreae]|uniref:amino acid ABC transporter permease n=1 Tax=Orbus mooreae TaxID=3074107 RepID=UPI00370D204D